MLGVSCFAHLQAPSPSIVSPGCPAGCVDIQGLAGSFVQLSHATKSLPSVSPKRGTRLLARSLPGFQPSVLEEVPQQGAAPGQTQRAAGRASHSPRATPAEWAAGRAPRASPGCTSQQAMGAPTLLKLPLLAASIRRSSAKKGDGSGSEKPSSDATYLTGEPRVGHLRLSGQLELLQVLTPWPD